MRDAIALGEDSAFHRWRIRAKNLYYELEFLESVWPKRLHRLVSRLSNCRMRLVSSMTPRFSAGMAKEDAGEFRRL
jgi:CHAD domain-containing protein